MAHLEPRAICFGCGAVLPAPFLDLGRTPLANAYLSFEQLGLDEEKFPLSIAYCPSCYLVQLTHPVAPEKMFGEYLYFSSFSDSFLDHSQKMADSFVTRFGLNSSSRVIEIASNDGYLLQFFLARGIPVLGIEAARNIAAEAERRGIPTLNRFFGPAAVEETLKRFGKADLIIGNNVLAHVPEINGFLSAVATCLSPRGSAVFEFPYLRELLDKIEFDTIYHEHVFYYSLNAIRQLSQRANLELFDVQHQKMHGGSLRIFLRHSGGHGIEPVVDAMLANESSAGLTSPNHFASFGQRVEDTKRRLLAMLSDLRHAQKRLAAYGAPAKGNTLLNYCGVGTELLEFTVDRSPYKQGKFLRDPISRYFLPPRWWSANRITH